MQSGGQTSLQALQAVRSSLKRKTTESILVTKLRLIGQQLFTAAAIDTGLLCVNTTALGVNASPTTTG